MKETVYFIQVNFLTAFHRGHSLSLGCLSEKPVMDKVFICICFLFFVLDTQHFIATKDKVKIMYKNWLQTLHVMLLKCD